MKHKSLHTFLLTTLLAASACIMKARAGTLYYEMCNFRLPIDSIPSSNHVEINRQISLSNLNKVNAGALFSVECAPKYDENTTTEEDLKSLQYLKLSNAEEIDASILSNADYWFNSNCSNFAPVGLGSVTLKYEGDILDRSAEVTRHITVDEVVTVVE